MIIRNRILEKIEKKDIKGGVVEIPENVFMIPGTVYYPEGIKTLVLSDSLKSIEQLAFQGCEALTTVLTDKLEFIGNSAFQGCKNLNNFVFPKTLKKIGTHAFDGCGFSNLRLESVNIEHSAFANCKELTSVEISANTELKDDVFDNCTNLSFLNMGPLMYKVLNVDGVCFITDEEPIKKDDLRVYRCFPLSRLSCDTLDYVYVGCRESVKVAGMNLKEIAQKIESKIAIQKMYQ